MDAENAKSNAQIRRFLNLHLDRLNSTNPCYAAAEKIFLPENNLGNEGSHMESMVKHRNDLRTFWQKKDRPGIRKGPGSAENYVAHVNELLRFQNLKFSTDLFTVTKGRTPMDMKMQLRQEMERYRTEILVAKTVFQKDRRIVTGKTGGGLNDDLYITIGQGTFWNVTTLTAPPSCFS